MVEQQTLIKKQYYGVIYKITNVKNNKIYIGQKIIKKSFVSEFRNYYGSGVKIKKIKKEFLSKEVIDIALDQKELDEKEIYYIDFYNSTNTKIGYNISIGGRNNISKSFIWVFKGEKEKLINKIEKDDFLKNGYSLGRVQRLFVNKNNKNKSIKKFELDLYLESGWVLGRINNVYNKITINNGVIERRVSKEESEYLIKKENYTKGRLLKNSISAKNGHKHKKQTEEHKKKIRDSQIGKIWIYKNNKSKKTTKENVENYLENGWSLGRNYENLFEGKRNTGKNKKWLNKDNIEKYVKTEDVQQFLNDGWVFGRCKSLKEKVSETLINNNRKI
jgi:hypothetical protein